jgi:hypothetical protein
LDRNQTVGWDGNRRYAPQESYKKKDKGKKPDYMQEEPERQETLAQAVRQPSSQYRPQKDSRWSRQDKPKPINGNPIDVPQRLSEGSVSVDQRSKSAGPMFAPVSLKITPVMSTLHEETSVSTHVPMPQFSEIAVGP